MLVRTQSAPVDPLVSLQSMMPVIETIFQRKSDETVIVVHGDDFTFLGYPDVLDKILTDMRTWWAQTELETLTKHRANKQKQKIGQQT